MLSLIAIEVRDLVDGDLASVTLRRDDGMLTTVVAEGVDADKYRGQIYPGEKSFSDQVLRTGEPMVVEDLSAVYVALRQFPEIAALGPSAFVPVRIDGPYGALSVCRVVGKPTFTQTDLDVIACFASQSALVIQSDCRRRRNASLDLIAEQARIAADLHDTAINEIFSASLTMSGLVNQTNPDQRELVVHAISALDNAIKLIRQAIFGLSESRVLPEAGQLDPFP